MSKGTLVVVTATISGTKGDGQVVNMHVCLICFLLLRIVEADLWEGRWMRRGEGTEIGC